MKYLLIVLSLSVFLVSGCAKNDARLKTEMVEGTIHLDGVPLSEAMIVFHPLSGSEVASGRSKEDGTFVVSSQNGAIGKGAVIGEYAVTVSKIEVTFSTNAEGLPSATEGKEQIPSQYLDKEKTPLKVEVKKGKNGITLDLSSK